MNKRTKTVISVLVIIAIIVAVIAIAVVKTGNQSDIEKEKITTSQNNSVKNTEIQKTTESGDSDTQTNFWDDVEVYEETSGEAKTDKNGETITESYPGEDEGWSPLVSPDDLEKGK